MFSSLLLVVLAGLLGPLLSAGRRPRVPVLVGELVGGAILGRTGFHLVDPGSQPLAAFATLGFAMLMLQSGAEVDIASPKLRQGAVRGLLAFLVTAAVSVPAGVAIGAATGTHHQLLFIVLLAGSSAAVAVPTIIEQRLDGPAIVFIIAWIALADAITALLMPLTIVGGGTIPRALLGDGLIILVTAAVIVGARRLLRTPIADDAASASRQRKWALRLRVSVLMLLILAAIAERTGASLLIAGFAAGIVLGRLGEPQRLQLELIGLANGFFVPVFFVLLGANLDLKGLLQDPGAIVVALSMAAAATAVHLIGSMIVGRDHRLASGLLASAQLGLPAAAAALGLNSGTVTPPIAAALVAGGLLTLIPASIGAGLLHRSDEDMRPATV